MDYPLISADSHVNPPPSMWREYLPAAFRDRAPRVESTDQGDFWVFEGNRRPAVVGLSAMAGRSFEKYTAGALRFDEVRPAEPAPHHNQQYRDGDRGVVLAWRESPGWPGQRP